MTLLAVGQPTCKKLCVLWHCKVTAQSRSEPIMLFELPIMLLTNYAQNYASDSAVTSYMQSCAYTSTAYTYHGQL